MPDPIDELENFTIPGPAMTPLPATEVRRRGDRIRRRNHALAAVGGLAVIAAIAAPFAVMAGHSSSSLELPPAQQAHWRHTIPASFDLRAVPDGSPIGFRAGRPFTDDQLICGKVVFSTRSGTDRAGASYHGENSEDSAGRTLAVFADDRQAAAVLADYRRGIESCPVDSVNRGARMEYDVVAGVPSAAEDGFVFSEQVHQGGLYNDLGVYEVARIGNAIFVGTLHGGPGGDPFVSQGVSRLAGYSDPVLEQMCVFSATGCGDARAEDPVTDEDGLSGAIPDDFPLESGLPTDAVRGQPSMGLEGLSHDL